MLFSNFKVLAAASFLSGALAAPFNGILPLEKRDGNCPQGLNQEDCAYLQDPKMRVLLGKNSFSTSTNGLWIDPEAPISKNAFTFQNDAGVDLILIGWNKQTWGGDEYGGFVVRDSQPEITYSIPKGGKVRISAADTYKGAFAAIYDRQTRIDESTSRSAGQVDNTWVEIDTSEFATIDVSKLVNMHGNDIKVVSGKCVSDNDNCVYKCRAGFPSPCGGAAGQVDLFNCNESNGGYTGLLNNSKDKPEGGCFISGASMNGNPVSANPAGAETVIHFRP